MCWSTDHRRERRIQIPWSGCWCDSPSKYHKSLCHSSGNGVDEFLWMKWKHVSFNSIHKTSIFQRHCKYIGMVLVPSNCCFITLIATSRNITHHNLSSMYCNLRLSEEIICIFHFITKSDDIFVWSCMVNTISVFTGFACNVTLKRYLVK